MELERRPDDVGCWLKVRKCKESCSWKEREPGGAGGSIYRPPGLAVEKYDVNL